MTTIRRLLILLLFVSLLFPGVVLAQGEVRLEEANIALWPEYDRPGMLVIYRIKLSPTVPLPTTLSFNIPTAAGEPNAVAEVDLNGDPYTVAYNREVHGDRAIIALTVTMPEIQLEYYDPGLQIEGDQREFSYTWMGDYAVDQLSFEVQQPVAAERLTISPSLGSSSPGQDGLQYYAADTGSHEQGESYTLSLAYQKPTDQLTFEIGPGMYPEPSGEIDQGTSGRVNLNDGVRWLAGFFVLLLLAGGIFWLVRMRNSPRLTPAPSPAKRGRRGSAGPEQEILAETGPYCHQCGKKAAPGDLFCRACGTRLRVEEK
jgi:hypothetical protein